MLRVCVCLCVLYVSVWVLVSGSPNRIWQDFSDRARKLGSGRLGPRKLGLEGWGPKDGMLKNFALFSLSQENFVFLLSRGPKCALGLLESLREPPPSLPQHSPTHPRTPLLASLSSSPSSLLTPSPSRPPACLKPPPPACPSLLLPHWTLLLLLVPPCLIPLPSLLNAPCLKTPLTPVSPPSPCLTLLSLA